MRFRAIYLTLPLLLACVLLFPTVRSDAQAPPPTARTTAALAPTSRQDAPLGLTASDGTGLNLVALKAQAVIEGPLAFTELHLTFANPEDRVLEGRFEITLPDGAAISRFAMKIDDRWQEAEVVERQAARVAYEDFLHRKQDPALLEAAAGNAFSARIFPIPARGRKELVLSYSQTLESASDIYRLPLEGLPTIGNLELEARVSSSEGPSLKPEIVAIRREGYKPEGDFVVSPGSQPSALRGGDFLVARVKPKLENAVSTPLRHLLVMVDTSASRALGHADQAGKVAQLIKSLRGLERVSVVAFDQEIVPLYEGPPAGFTTDKLLARQAFGATDLAAALSWASARKNQARLLLVTDGVSTAGSDELKAALKDSALQRLDVLLVGGIRDKARMESLVSDGLEQDGMVLDGDLSATEVAQRLRLGVTSGVDVAVSDAVWVWPATLDNLQPGDERLIYAQLKPGKSSPVVSLGGVPVDLAVAPSQAPPLLQRQATVARIARLESVWMDTTDQEAKGRIDREIVLLSTTHRVLSSRTALLVLETEEDYARFHIDRTSLADILTVGPRGLLLEKRSDAVVAVKAPTRVSEEKAKVASSVPASDSRAPNSGPSQQASATTAASLPAEEPADEPVTEASVQESPMASLEQDASPRATMSQPTTAPAPRRAQDEPSRTAGAVGQMRESPQSDDSEGQDSGEVTGKAPLTGRMAEIHELLLRGKYDAALSQARAWQKAEPGNVLALIALGDVLEAKKLLGEAARVYGSIIDLFPARADLRRFAGSRLEGLGPAGLPLAVDSFGKAVEQRSDHVSSHRFLALALARQGDYEKAFAALEKGLAQDYPSDRFRSYDHILRDDLGIVGAAWVARSPQDRSAVVKRLDSAGAVLSTKPSLRFVLTWETDANDVDFHIHDARQGHAFYSSPKLASGGELYGDVTTGYGPECFAIDGKPKAFPYRLQIHYYSRGPMGYGMGQLEILQHDGQGHLLFEERPYVVMEDGAYVDLGIVEEPLSAR